MGFRKQTNNKPLYTSKKPQIIDAKPPSPTLAMRIGSFVKKILLWSLVVIFVLFTIAYIPHIAGFIALVAAIIVAPIDKWQNLISYFIKGKIKTVIIAILTVFAFFAAPSTNSPEVDPTVPLVSVTESTEIIESSAIPATIPATKADIDSSTQPVTEPATEPQSEPTLSPVDVEKIVFDEEIYIVGVGRTVYVPFTLYPENATTLTLESSISNEKVAALTFENSGERLVHITGIAPGKATIYLKSGNDIVAQKEIAVAEVLPEGIKIIAQEERVLIGSKGTFATEFAPTDVTTQKVTWKSSAPNIVKVNWDGTYQALTVGKATITATHASGITGTLEIDVLPVEVEKITLSSNWDLSKSFCRNNTMTLKAEILPQNATDKSIIWTSSDDSIATVSDKGVVKALSAGQVVITAKSANGKQCQFNITVEPSPQKFRVSTSITMKSNDHVGSKWRTGFEFNGEPFYTGATVSIMTGDVFTVGGWAEESDSKPDYDDYSEKLTLTEEMCTSGFTVEGEVKVRENGGRYSGNYAVWYVKIKFTPTQ